MASARTASLAFILISVLINVMGLGLIIPVLPKLIATLAGSVEAGAQINGIFFAVYALMQFVFGPILGLLSDRYGRRPVLLASSLGTALDYLIAALTQSIWILFLARVVAGALGASLSTANAYIADISKPNERARNFGLIGATFGMGFVLGPVVGGVLGNIDLRLPFFFAAGLAFLNFLYGYFVLPESLRPENRNHNARSLNPFTALKILGQTPLLRGLTSSLALIFLAFGVLQSVWVLYTAYKFDWKPLEVGFSLFLVGLGGVVVQAVLIRPVVAGLGERRALILGQSVSIFSFTLYGLATQGWMMYAIIVLAAFSNLGQPLIQSFLTREVSPQEQGALQGALAGAQSLTVAAGGLLGGFIFAMVVGLEHAEWLVGLPFFVGALMYLLAAINTTRLFRRTAEATTRPS
ncbi:TCR/Tet family MFS transporter [uncultured Meiothermus sp.]|jgi:DHA1 family tetracycline resistance protein-like MFS transporter|uniref:TCR/Tet family MFS transporter n=1 Tax=uncultured Meiothermus sp. TaxID=157471 RepID=UPI002610E73E|nr:TCR/Tet family MFS transporter [uncultured Meiothermus sp.]